MNIIHMLVDYRGAFYSSSFNIKQLCSMNVEEIRRRFREAGYDLRIKQFSDVDFRKDDFKNQFVLYQSSEDPGSMYKGYIEDILLGLRLQGAILIPQFEYFRASQQSVRRNSPQFKRQ